MFICSHAQLQITEIGDRLDLLYALRDCPVSIHMSIEGVNPAELLSVFQEQAWISLEKKHCLLDEWPDFLFINFYKGENKDGRSPPSDHCDNHDSGSIDSLQKIYTANYIYMIKCCRRCYILSICPIM